jgi:hypothetical protein
VRLADAVFRSGHLSEEALAEVCMTGTRPAHLDRCDVCADRVRDLGRWLEDVRALALTEADAAFPPERLAAQQAQILRRLEQVDRPARVIAFPAQPHYGALEGGAHGIRPAWVGFAAAAGLVLGLVGGQISARMTAPRPAPAVATVPVAAPLSASVSYDPPSASLNDLDEYDRPSIDSAKALDDMTPHALTVSDQVVMHSSRSGR